MRNSITNSRLPNGHTRAIADGIGVGYGAIVDDDLPLGDGAIRGSAFDGLLLGEDRTEPDAAAQEYGKNYDSFIHDQLMF